MAVAGFRLTLWLVAAGLLVHALLDSIHPLVVANDGVPGWWPAFCLAFDVAFAAWLAGRLAIDGASPGAKLVEPVMPE